MKLVDEEYDYGLLLLIMRVFQDSIVSVLATVVIPENGLILASMFTVIQ
jgi:hypothetical protein